jgi:formate hydrogenlyase transcriptional activator
MIMATVAVFPKSAGFSGFCGMIGESPEFRNISYLVEMVAGTDSAVLIQGETGTGKELLAKAIHEKSLRSRRPFVKVNCAAMPSGLLESELFGHERGAFTGALNQSIGRFERAHKGTLFLDEIGDLPLELQPKLLRVLQEKEFERLGNSQTMHVDVRIIVATNQDLCKMVQEGRFRADLYYRLNVFPIGLPPLRARRSDIPPLVHHFVEQFADRLNKEISYVPDEAMVTLYKCDWPGNVRELQNFIERAVIMSSGSELRLPPFETRLSIQPILGIKAETLIEAERDHILKILAEARGVVGGPRGAASRLGLPRTSLIYKMRKLGINKEHAKSRSTAAEPTRRKCAAPTSIG